jgi:hypothetical protein
MTDTIPTQKTAQRTNEHERILILFDGDSPLSVKRIAPVFKCFILPLNIEKKAKHGAILWEQIPP